MVGLKVVYLVQSKVSLLVAARVCKQVGNLVGRKDTKVADETGFSLAVSLAVLTVDEMVGKMAERSAF